MVKEKTIGMIEKNAKNEPTVKAHADLKNGTIFVISNGVTAYPTEGTSGSHQTKDLYIALNSGSGDERFTDFTIKKDDFVNGFLLRAWENQEIIFDESHIEYGQNQSYSSLNVGTKLVATSSGKFKIESSVTNYGIYFEITEKLQFNGNAVSAKIVMN